MNTELTILIAGLLALFVGLILLYRDYQKKIRACIIAFEQSKENGKKNRKDIRDRIAEVKTIASENRIEFRKKVDELNEQFGGFSESLFKNIDEIKTAQWAESKKVASKIEDLDFELFKLNNPMLSKMRFIDSDGDKFTASKVPGKVKLSVPGEPISEVSLDTFYADWFKGEIAIDEK